MKLQRDQLHTMADAKRRFTVDDLATRVVAGAALHAYRVTNIATKAIDSVFVDSQGRIARIESANSVTQLSNFGEAVTIVAPM